MNAAVLFEYKEPLRIEDVEIEEPRDNEVLLEVKATGLCHSDLNVFLGLTPVPTPVILGHEISGVVRKIGRNVTRVNEGDKVISTFIHPCGKCLNCISGYENLCETFSSVRLKGTMFDGTTRLRLKDGKQVRAFLGGGFAEYSIVHENAVVSVNFATDDELEKLAILGCAGITAFGAVNIANIKPGDSVVVIGVGGVGLSIIQLLKAVGAGRIIALGTKKWKLEKALELGATDVINVKEHDAVKEVRKILSRGADVVIEASGNEEAIKNVIEMVRLGGKVVLVGLPPTHALIPLKVAMIVRNGVTIVGSYGGRPRVDMMRLLELVRSGKFDPSKQITGRFKLDEINEAMKLLENGEIIRGLIIPK